mgnify:FL=1
MAYHTKNGHEFVGLRVSVGGEMQVVYDALAGKRRVLEIKSRSTNQSTIDDALRESIVCKNVFSGLVTALNARSIEIDYLD